LSSNKIQAYSPKFSPSSIVSGKRFPKVSGMRRARSPAARDAAPNINNGSGFHKSPF